jgi:uncharacterized protein
MPTHGEIVASDFRPAWWLRNRHLQTVGPAVFVRVPLTTRRECLELPDGDFVDLDWVGGPDRGRPIVIVLSGLAGDIRSHYVRRMLRAVERAGWRGVLMHFRGCSGRLNRRPRFFHSGDTGDVAFLADTLRRHEPRAPLFAVGYSLGGNALCKWLGEGGDSVPLAAAAAVSVPYDLGRSVLVMERGLSRLYQRRLVGHLTAAIRRKMKAMDMGLGLTPDDVARLRTFRQFDDRVTAPLHGFRDADDYYSRSSCGQYLRGVTRPTLLIHAEDDPFVDPTSLPTPADLAAAVRLELSHGGGHVGFVAGANPLRPRGFLQERVLRHLRAHLR